MTQFGSYQNRPDSVSPARLGPECSGGFTGDDSKRKRSTDVSTDDRDGRTTDVSTGVEAFSDRWDVRSVDGTHPRWIPQQVRYEASVYVSNSTRISWDRWASFLEPAAAAALHGASLG